MAGRARVVLLLAVALAAFAAGHLTAPRLAPLVGALTGADSGADSGASGAGAAAVSSPPGQEPDGAGADAGAETAAAADPPARIQLLAPDAQELQRLRRTLVEREQRIEALTEAVGALGQAATAGEPELTSISRTSERQVNATLQLLNAALEGGGARQVSVLEVGGVGDGRVHDLLVTFPPEPGAAPRASTWASARLAVDDGLARLVLERPSAEDPSATELHEILLPTADEERFAAAGLVLPSGEVMVSQALVALTRLLEDQPFEVLSVGGVSGDELLDVELLEFEAGVLRRRLRADRLQVLPAGPTLLLLDGEVTVDGETRGFYRGALRLPLPGARYADWLTTLFG